MADTIALLLLLVGLELVLGVDNVLVISIFVGKLPKNRRKIARIIGLSIAMIARILMVIAVLALASLTRNVIGHFSVRDIVLIAGGMFLLFKAVREIHHTVELRDEDEGEGHPNDYHGYALVVIQIVLLDIVFSIDSVITAVGLTGDVWIIIGAVVLSFLLIMAYAGPVGEFIIGHPTLKILALAFLITIGVTIFMEGMHKEVPKAYIYLPMGFALAVELLQMRYEHNLNAKSGN